MSILIAAVIVLWIVYMMGFSCLFNHHNDEIVERDDAHHCHKIRCTKCGREDTMDPWAGIGG
jgi:hypothetical protein